MTVNFFLFDGSALVKRYFPEPGTPLVAHLFAQAPRTRLLCLMLGAAEAAAALVRKRNQGALAATAFSTATRELRSEIVDAVDFTKLASDNPTVLASIPFSEKHAINATDAVVLQHAIELASQLRAVGDDLVLVVTDRRLLRAAQAEGLLTFDPETQTQAELDAFLGP
jgi:predicted nucleic acid-binding protein